MVQPSSLESLTPRLIGRDGKPMLTNRMINSHAVDNYVSDEELLDSEEEADMSILPQEVIHRCWSSVHGTFWQLQFVLHWTSATCSVTVFFLQELFIMVESLRAKLLAERKKNLMQEIQIRKEMGDAMMQQIMEIEESHRCVKHDQYVSYHTFLFFN